jgi:hypothetical protein
MRTTIRLDDQLLVEAKKRAAETGRTLNAVIEDAVRASLARPEKPRKRGRLRLPIFAGRGLQPGIDLDRTSDLLDRMERPDAAG